MILTKMAISVSNLWFYLSSLFVVVEGFDQAVDHRRRGFQQHLRRGLFHFADASAQSEDRLPAGVRENVKPD
jgi:hypothetical protein